MLSVNTTAKIVLNKILSSASFRTQTCFHCRAIFVDQFAKTGCKLTTKIRDLNILGKKEY